MVRRRLPIQGRFAKLVQSGEKTQTIRMPQKHPIRPGNTLVFYRWLSVPYRSKTKVLGEWICKSVQKIFIDKGAGAFVFEIDGRRLVQDEWASLCRADGFYCTTDLLDYFEKRHGLPFKGVLIRW